MAATNENKHSSNNILMKSTLSAAKQRWKILAHAIHGRRSESTRAVSVRRFESYGLLQTSPLDKDSDDSDCRWFQYTCPIVCPDFKVDIKQLVGPVKLEDFMGFNNTGNVCVWPSEEALTFYCLKNKIQFRDKKICELGGGMTCLAGMALSVFVDADEILLTDGNDQSVANVKSIIEQNTSHFKTKCVRSSLMLWDEKIHLEERDTQFDFVICADCLFFDEYRAGLAHTIHSLLKPKGEAIIFAPRRGQTFDAFVELVSTKFKFQEYVQYDKMVWQRHLEMKSKGIEEYDMNIHYPRLLILEKL